MVGVAIATVLAGCLSAVMPAKPAGVLGSLAFGIGFVLISLERSELFTENFLIPVGAVLERRRPAPLLPRLWLPTLLAYLAGMLVLGLMLSRRTVLDHSAVMAAADTADVFAERSGVLGGVSRAGWNESGSTSSSRWPATSSAAPCS